MIKSCPNSISFNCPIDNTQLGCSITMEKSIYNPYFSMIATDLTSTNPCSISSHMPNNEPHVHFETCSDCAKSLVKSSLKSAFIYFVLPVHELIITNAPLNLISLKAKENIKQVVGVDNIGIIFKK